jgi:hypothetical protein
VHLPLHVPPIKAAPETSAPPAAAANVLAATSAVGAPPPRSTPPLGITVAGETRTWHEGQPLVFDDTYEHSTWNGTSGDRVVLLFDVWHPDLSQAEVDAVVAMFEDARRQGLLK